MGDGEGSAHAMIWCWHKWSKWEPFFKIVMEKDKFYIRWTQGYKPLKWQERWQRRHCIKCGFIQEREI